MSIEKYEHSIAVLDRIMELSKREALKFSCSSNKQNTSDSGTKTIKTLEGLAKIKNQ